MDIITNFQQFKAEILQLLKQKLHLIPVRSLKNSKNWNLVLISKSKNKNSEWLDILKLLMKSKRDTSLLLILVTSLTSLKCKMSKSLMLKSIAPKDKMELQYFWKILKLVFFQEKWLITQMMRVFLYSPMNSSTGSSNITSDLMQICC